MSSQPENSISKQWYIHKQPTGECTIVSSDDTNSDMETWGPFTSQSEAIARRIGLIRSGKCKPV